MERSKYYAAIKEGIDQQVRQLHTRITSVICILLVTLFIDYMVEFLGKQINNYISTWVPKSKVMSTEEITKWLDDG